MACPTCPRALRAHVTKYILQSGNLKNIGFKEIKWRFVHWCFQGCRILICTLIKISFFKIGSKNIELFYAEGQNNTYKCSRSKQHLSNNKGHAEGKEYISTLLALVRYKTKGQWGK